LLAVGTLALAQISGARGRGSAVRRRMKQIWLWLGATLAMVVVQWRCYAYHFLVILPPLALLSSLAVGELLRRSRRWTSSLARAITIGVCLVTYLLPVAGGASRFGLACRIWSGELPREKYWDTVNAVGWYPFSNAAHVADYLRSHSQPDDPILVYDFDPVIYYLAQRQSPTRHLSVAPMFALENIPVVMRRAWLDEQMRDVTARPPLYLVVRDGIGSPTLASPIVPYQRGNRQCVHYAADDYGCVGMFTHDKIYRRLTRSDPQASRAERIATDLAGSHSP